MYPIPCNTLTPPNQPHNSSLPPIDQPSFYPPHYFLLQPYQTPSRQDQCASPHPPALKHTLGLPEITIPPSNPWPKPHPANPIVQAIHKPWDLRNPSPLPLHSTKPPFPFHPPPPNQLKTFPHTQTYLPPCTRPLTYSDRGVHPLHVALFYQ